MKAKIEEPNENGVYCKPYKEIVFSGERLWCVKIELHNTSDGIKYRPIILGSSKPCNRRSPAYQSENEAVTAFLAEAESKILEEIDRTPEYREIEMKPYGKSAYKRHLGTIRKIIAQQKQLKLF